MFRALSNDNANKNQTEETENKKDNDRKKIVERKIHREF